MRPTFVYDINNVIIKLYMQRHVSGGILCNEYCIRSDHEENRSHFIMSFTIETEPRRGVDLGVVPHRLERRTNHHL